MSSKDIYLIILQKVDANVESMYPLYNWANIWKM